MSDLRSAPVPRALKDAVPLRLWIVAGTLCALCLAAGLAAMAWARALSKDEVNAQIVRQIQLIQKLPSPASRKGPLVVLVGSSLVRHAVADSVTLEKLIGRDAEVLLLYSDDARASWIDGILPSIEHARPDLLLLQYEMFNPPLGEPQQGFVRSVTFIINSLQEGSAHAVEPSVEQQCAARRGRSLRVVVMEDGTIEFASAPNPRVLSLVERYRRSGTRIAILDLPRAQELVQAQPVLSRWHDQTLQGLMAHDFEIWTPPGGWKAGDYCDFAHLNPRGRARFEPWLAEQIRHALERPQ
jgi:hypothetical protein